MLDSIGRVGQPQIDWSQATNSIKTSKLEQDFKVLGAPGKSSEYKHQGYSQEKLSKEIEQMNSQLENLNHSLRIKFSEEAEQFYVEVIDVRTKEVLESIPGKHMIELAAKLKDMIGFFVDEKR